MELPDLDWVHMHHMVEDPIAFELLTQKVLGQRVPLLPLEGPWSYEHYHSLGLCLLYVLLSPNLALTDRVVEFLFVASNMLNMVDYYNAWVNETYLPRGLLMFRKGIECERELNDQDLIPLMQTIMVAVVGHRCISNWEHSLARRLVQDAPELADDPVFWLMKAKARRSDSLLTNASPTFWVLLLLLNPQRSNVGSRELAQLPEDLEKHLVSRVRSVAMPHPWNLVQQKALNAFAHRREFPTYVEVPSEVPPEQGEAWAWVLGLRALAADQPTTRRDALAALLPFARQRQKQHWQEQLAYHAEMELSRLAATSGERAPEFDPRTMELVDALRARYLIQRRQQAKQWHLYPAAEVMRMTRAERQQRLAEAYRVRSTLNVGYDPKLITSSVARREMEDACRQHAVPLAVSAKLWLTLMKDYRQQFQNIQSDNQGGSPEAVATVFVAWTALFNNVMRCSYYTRFYNFIVGFMLGHYNCLAFSTWVEALSEEFGFRHMLRFCYPPGHIFVLVCRGKDILAQIDNGATKPITWMNPAFVEDYRRAAGQFDNTAFAEVFVPNVKITQCPEFQVVPRSFRRKDSLWDLVDVSLPMTVAQRRYIESQWSSQEEPFFR